MSSIEVVILGSGTSHGVPMIGCKCAVCLSDDPRDHRTRPSIWIRTDQQAILIDTTPELRLQCLANGIDRVDAVLYTHHHADHVAGLDDLRRFNHLMHATISCHATEQTIASLRRMFSYAFEPGGDDPTSRPRLELCAIDHSPFTIGSATVTPIPLFHGEMPILGFRIGKMAYCTDCSRIPDASYPLLEGLDLLVLDALRRRPHPTHFNIEQAVDEAQRIGAKQTLFTHIAHALGHAETNAELPQGIALAHDEQRIVVGD